MWNIENRQARFRQSLGDSWKWWWIQQFYFIEYVKYPEISVYSYTALLVYYKSESCAHSSKGKI